MKNNCEQKQELLSASELAEKLGICKRQVWRLHCAGELPAPIKLGHLVKWPKSEIDDWILSGAPQRNQWESRKGEKQK